MAWKLTDPKCVEIYTKYKKACNQPLSCKKIRSKGKILKRNRLLDECIKGRKRFMVECPQQITPGHLEMVEHLKRARVICQGKAEQKGLKPKMLPSTHIEDKLRTLTVTLNKDHSLVQKCVLVTAHKHNISEDDVLDILLEWITR